MINGRETIVLLKILYTCLLLFWQLPMSGQTRLLLPFFFVSHMKVKVKVAQWCLTLCDPVDCTVHGILQARILEWVAFPFSRGSFQPRIKPRSPALQVDPLPAEPPGKCKNTGVGSLSLLQQIFPKQELNWSLLHYRQILYQLSSQGSPDRLLPLW